MAARKTSREPVPLPDITIDEAFQMLVTNSEGQYSDRVLNAAFADGKLPLWEAEHLVHPRFFANSLEVSTKVDAATGRHHAEIAATRSLDPERSYVWRTSTKAVTNFIKAAKHPGGRPRTYSHEEILIAAAVYLQARCKPRPPTPSELESAVALILDDRTPAESHLGSILRPLLSQLHKGLDAEMLQSLKLGGN